LCGTNGTNVITLLLNSLLTAGLATLVTAGFGFAAALAISALPANLRRVALAISLLALALPPFLVTNCWLHYLGNTGVWKGWLPLDIFGIGGVVWILALMLWPIVLMATLSAWRSLDRAHFESEPELRGARLIRWLLWPAARNSLVCGAALTFALALNQFAVPAILQVKILPVEAWIRFSTELKPGDALAVSWPIIIIPVSVLVLLGRIDISWIGEMGEPSGAALSRQLGTRWVVGAASVAILVLLMSVALPLFQLFSAGRTWTELPGVWKATWPVALNSAMFAFGAAGLALALALLNWRSRAGWILCFLFLVPGMLFAIGIIWLLNRTWLEVVYRSFGVLVVALGLRYAGPVWVLVRQGFRMRDAALVDAARLEGLGRWATLRHVYWPRGRTAGLAAGYTAYLLCLWDAEITSLLYPPGAETLAVRAFNLLHYGHDATVNALCLILLAVAAGPALLYGAWAAVQKRASL
jgi:iron(III) transport system permease protein